MRKNKQKQNKTKQIRQGLYWTLDNVEICQFQSKISRLSTLGIDRNQGLCIPYTKIVRKNFWNLDKKN